MVVAYDRELCVLYQKDLERLLAACGDGWESTVVISTRGKNQVDTPRSRERSCSPTNAAGPRRRRLSERFRGTTVTFPDKRLSYRVGQDIVQFPYDKKFLEKL